MAKAQECAQQFQAPILPNGLPSAHLGNTSSCHLRDEPPLMAWENGRSSKGKPLEWRQYKALSLFLVFSRIRTTWWQ